MKALARIIAIAMTAFISSGHVLATADGPDHYQVRGVASDDTLNVRTAPSSDAPVIASLAPDADGIANFGCIGELSYAEWEKATPEEREQAAEARWCRIGFGDTIGWSAGRFLAEGSDTKSFTGGRLVMELADTAWRLRDFAGETVEPDVTVSFGPEGRAFGSGGCNRFNGSFTLDRGRLTFGPIAATRMACPDPVNQIEMRFFKTLEATAEIVATKRLLAFFSADHDLLATFLRDDPPAP